MHIRARISKASKEMFNGQKVKVLLATQGKTSAELAQKLFGNPRRAITPVINGNPTVNTLEALADFFKVPIDVFFLREVNIAPTEEEPVKGSQYVDLLVAAKNEIIKKQEEEIALLRSENKSLKRRLNAKLKN